MKLSDTLSLSTRMFRTRPMRTFLTILGVSIGIGAVLFLVSLGYGLQNLILSRITTADALLSLDISPGASEFISLNKESADKMAKLEHVAEVSPVVTLNGQMALGKYTGDCLIKGIDASFFRLDGIMAKNGEIFSDDNAKEAVISSAGATLFNMSPEEIIGKELSILLLISKSEEDSKEDVESVPIKDKLRVVGVVEDENSSFIYVPRKALSSLVEEKYSQIKIKVDSEASINFVRADILNMGFMVSALSDTIEQAKKIFRVVQIVLALFGIVALLVSAIGMFNTMTIALLERINEIGIMRAIGVTKRDLMTLFLVESSLMGFLGGIGGVAIGYLGGELANAGMNLLARSFGGQSLSLFYRPLWFIVVIIIFSTIIGFFTGVYPSLKASRINPLEALRYK